jgi:hypothetical protein
LFFDSTKEQYSSETKSPDKNSQDVQNQLLKEVQKKESGWGTWQDK